MWQIHIPFLVFGVCVFASFWRLSCGFGFLGSKLSSPRCRHSFRLCICVCGCAYICVYLCVCVCASKLQLQALCSCSWTLLWLHILQNSLRSSTAVALTTLAGSVAACRGDRGGVRADTGLEGRGFCGICFAGLGADQSNANRSKLNAFDCSCNI